MIPFNMGELFLKVPSLPPTVGEWGKYTSGEVKQNKAEIS